MELEEMGETRTDKNPPANKPSYKNRDSRRSTYSRLTNSNSDRNPKKLRNCSVVSVTSEKKLDLDCPLHIAVRRGNHPEVIQVVKKAAVADFINGLNNEGMTALHLAAKLFSKVLSKEISATLLQSGAMVDLKTLDRSTALHFAVR